VFTFIIALVACVLLFLAILVATLTLPFGALIKNFPGDVQESLKDRIENLPMSPKRLIGGILTVLIFISWVVVFIIGGIDGLKNNFTFFQFLIRFLIIALSVKVFDIVCLDSCGGFHTPMLASGAVDLFCSQRRIFFQHFFPETENCKGWKEFGYNRKQQIRQCILIPVLCVISAYVFTLFQLERI